MILKEENRNVLESYDLSYKLFFKYAQTLHGECKSHLFYIF